MAQIRQELFNRGLNRWGYSSMADELVTIATYDLIGTAHIVQAKLESQEIESYLVDENMTAMFWHYNMFTKGIKLQVKRSDAERACQVIESGISRGAEQQTDLPPDVPAFDAATDICCPKCNSENIYLQNLSRVVAVFSIILLGFPIPFLRRKWRCSDCWHQWKQKLPGTGE